MKICVVVTSATSGTVLAREIFPDSDAANEWLTDAINSGRFGRPDRWIDPHDAHEDGVDLGHRNVWYTREEHGMRTYYVTGDFAVNTEPM